ncbi:MAG: glycosyltransferase family 4 protein [Chloroflexi bacterium]|nr:glycosyltransferase family 4 protein [Chloroflexota bacterium]
MVTLKVALNGAFLHRPDTGSGQYLTHLLAELRDPTYGVEMVVHAPASGGNLAKVRFEQIGFPASARASGADVAHVPYFGSAWLTRLPTVVTVHDLIPVVLPLYRGSAKVRAYTKLVSLAAARARVILADSEASKRDIVAYLGIDESRVRVVYLAADERYKPVTDSAALDAVRAKYRLPESFALYLGGFDQRKNVPNLVRAFASVARGLGPDYSLVLAGRPPATVSDFFPDVGTVVHDLELTEHVQWIGEVDETDKPALYTLAGCFVFPSYYEGFGLPVLEAMACGTPVVAGNRGSLPEIVGDAGFLVEPDEVARIAGAIIASLIDEPLRAAHRRKGLARAAMFSWTQCARETVEAYQLAASR